MLPPIGETYSCKDVVVPPDYFIAEISVYTLDEVIKGMEIILSDGHLKYDFGDVRVDHSLCQEDKYTFSEDTKVLGAYGLVHPTTNEVERIGFI